jgi:ATP-dependent Clp protease adaptor protein ClpS
MTFYNYTQANSPQKNTAIIASSVRMDAPSGNGGDHNQSDGELMLAEPQTKVKRPPLYKVILLNDDYTPMDFVVSVLKQIFRKPPADAMEIMLKVHEKGAAIVAIYPRDIAETKLDEVIEYARISEYPLQCIMEKE